MVAAEDMTGRNGHRVRAIHHEELVKVMRRYRRLKA
jgi:hypothetical protein